MLPLHPSTWETAIRSAKQKRWPVLPEAALTPEQPIGVLHAADVTTQHNRIPRDQIKASQIVLTNIG